MKNFKRIKEPRRQSGFTFLEVIVVVAILLLLASLVVINYVNRAEQAKVDAAKIQIKALSNAIQLYHLDNGFYPTTDQGLKALVEKPDSDPEPKKWKKYIDKVPQDAWGHDYIYIQPGTHGDFDLFSYGKDGAEGEDDITSWEDTENK